MTNNFMTTAVKTFLVFVFTTFHFCAFGQSKDSVTIHSFYKFQSDKLVKVKLKPGQMIDIRLNEYVDTIKGCAVRKEYYTGYFSKLTDSTIVIKCFDHGKTINCKDSTIRINVMAEKHRDFNATINLDRIYYIELTRKSSSAFFYIGIVSVVTALVVAPAVSYNYSTGTFNSERYLSIMKPCLIGTALGFSYAITIGNKNLKIRPTRNKYHDQ
jgi:hypothetical protein